MEERLFTIRWPDEFPPLTPEVAASAVGVPLILGASDDPDRHQVGIVTAAHAGGGEVFLTVEMNDDLYERGFASWEIRTEPCEFRAARFVPKLRVVGRSSLGPLDRPAPEG